MYYARRDSINYTVLSQQQLSLLSSCCRHYPPVTPRRRPRRRLRRCRRGGGDGGEGWGSLGGPGGGAGGCGGAIPWSRRGGGTGGGGGSATGQWDIQCRCSGGLKRGWQRWLESAVTAMTAVTL